MQESKVLPEVLYVAETTRERRIYSHEPPPPGQGTNGMLPVFAIVQDRTVEVRDDWETFPDGTVFAVYRMERMRAVQRSVELVDVPMPERRK